MFTFSVKKIQSNRARERHQTTIESIALERYLPTECIRHDLYSKQL